jgi:hypothetical protein
VTFKKDYENWKAVFRGGNPSSPDEMKVSDMQLTSAGMLSRIIWAIRRQMNHHSQHLDEP